MNTFETGMLPIPLSIPGLISIPIPYTNITAEVQER